MSKTAYPITTEPVSITLYCNIPFDNTYTHHSLISELFKYNNTQIYNKPLSPGTYPCEEFIDRRDYSKVGRPYVYPRWTLTDVFNFDFKNGILGDVVLELTNAQTNANYLKVDNRGVRWYYFITGINQLNNGTYRLSLELDVIMTYQDEFLNGIKDIPVFTERKHSHRYSENGLNFHCADFKSGDNLFAGVKPNIIKGVKFLDYDTNSMKTLKGIYWLYVCIDAHAYDSYTNSLLYESNGNKYPIYMIAIPINANSITYKKSDDSCLLTYSRTDIENGIKLLINDGSIHGCKISPYPPFSTDNDTNPSITINSNKDLTISTPNVSVISEDAYSKEYMMTIGGSKLLYAKVLQSLDNTWKKALTYGFVCVSEQNEPTYKHINLKYSDFDLRNSSVPTINSQRFEDPKLFFAPFRKYIINAQYATQGYEFHLELYCSQYTTNSNADIIGFKTHATAYIGDNNYYTEITNVAGQSTFANYNYEKLGLACSVNYNMPCGENALDVFNSTQQQSFYTSKVASGITAGISIGGGIASVVGGAGLIGTGAGSAMGMAMVAGGMSAIAGGSAGMINTIKSTTAKLEDLKNTPDSINISGSNFISDINILKYSYSLPYVTIYDCDLLTKKNANDYFYSYGYQTARNCYFNTELKYDYSGGKIDNNLFGRTIFNYIKTQEDITNKINADIPHIIKKKLSSIFNQGITLWSFFGIKGLWNTTNPTSQEYVENWFLKNELDNTEYNG